MSITRFCKRKYGIKKLFLFTLVCYIGAYFVTVIQRANGPVLRIVDVLPQILSASKVKLGQAVENCGMPKSCPTQHLAVMVSTGKDSTVLPEICQWLSGTSKEKLNQLGSGVIQNLKFRDVWYFVGQMGITGFTHIEQISYAGMDAEWPTPLNDSFCVPKKIESRKIIADAIPHRNDARRDFCKKYDAYPEFCDRGDTSSHLLAESIGTLNTGLPSTLNNSESYLIVLEDELILSPDFMFFLAQCSQALEVDKTLTGVLAFNYNELWLRWSLPLSNKSEENDMLVPDVSRVYRFPYERVGENEQYLDTLFNRPRNTNMNYVLFYNQTRYNDYSVLVNLCQCFGLAASPGHPPKNMYRGILRFTYEGNNIMLVGSQSIFNRLKPTDFKLYGV